MKILTTGCGKMNSHCKRKAKDDSFMFLISLTPSLAALLPEMRMEISRKMHGLSYTLVLMGMPGGMLNKFLNRFTRPYRFSKQLILGSKHYLFSISHQPMHHSHPMH